MQEGSTLPIAGSPHLLLIVLGLSVASPSHHGAPHSTWLASHLSAQPDPWLSSLCCCLWGGPKLKPHRESISLSFSHDQLMVQCSSPVLSPSQWAPVPQEAWVRMSSNIALQYQTTHSDPPSWGSVLPLCNWLLSHNTDQPQLCLYMSDPQVVWPGDPKQAMTFRKVLSSWNTRKSSRVRKCCPNLYQVPESHSEESLLSSQEG